MTQSAKPNSLKTALLISACVSLIATTVQAQSALVEFDIDPQELGNALTEFGIQSSQEIFFVEADVKDKRSPGVEGFFEPEAALTVMLNGTKVPFTTDENGTILVGNEHVREVNLTRPALVTTRPRADAETGAKLGSPIRMAQVNQKDEVQQVERSVDEDTMDEQEAEDVIVVTGTNIRGIAPESSPSITFTRDDIFDSGASTAQEFIQTLPQNFRGGSNAEISSLPNDREAAFNTSLGSSVNLRGLGSGSTLVLLNGNRLAPASVSGNFVDISMIPATAIGRVEVLPDGASSIYGADAVAGVVNFVLRDDFDGQEVTFRYGAATEGGLSEYRAGATVGRAWEDGNALITYEYNKQNELNVSDRDFLDSSVSPNFVSPDQDRHSILVSGEYRPSSTIELGGDLLYSTRSAFDVITRSNGSASNTIVDAEALNASLRGSWNFSQDWYLDTSMVYGFSKATSETNDRDEVAAFTNGSEQDSTLFSTDLRVNGSLYELPAGQALFALGGSFRKQSVDNATVSAVGSSLFIADREVVSVYSELQIPIVSDLQNVRGIRNLDLNLSGRYEDYSDFGTAWNPKVGFVWGVFEPLRLRASYGTSFVPPAIGRSGAQDSTAQVYSTAFINSIFGLTPADPSIADVVVLRLIGTGQNLVAEESTSFSAGFDFVEEFGSHELTVSGAYFDVDFKNRLNTTPVPDGRSVFDAANIAFSDPTAFPPGTIVFGPSSEELLSALNTLVRPPLAFGGANPLDTAIIDRAFVLRNLSKTRVSGIDFAISHEAKLNGWRTNASINGSYILDYDEQAVEGTPFVNRLNSLYNPVDLNLRGQIGLAKDGVSGNIFVNYTDEYTVSNLPNADRIASWTTVDLNLFFDLGYLTGGDLFKGLNMRLSVINLFDQDPPTVPAVADFGFFGYDPTNANPRGRFVAFELIKRF